MTDFTPVDGTPSDRLKAQTARETLLAYQKTLDDNIGTWFLWPEGLSSTSQSRFCYIPYEGSLDNGTRCYRRLPEYPVGEPAPEPRKPWYKRIFRWGS